MEEKEKIRRAYYVEKKSIRQIARDLKYARQTVRKAIQSAEPEKYKLTLIPILLGWQKRDN